MKPKSVTEGDLLAAVMEATAQAPNDPGVSIAEYVAANPGLSVAQATLRLNKGVAAGRLLSGWAYKRDRGNGQYRRVRVYRPNA